MDEYLRVGDNTYEFSPESKVRLLDTSMLETGKMLAVLEGMLARVDRLLPRDVKATSLPTIKLAEIGNQLEDIKSLYNETGFHLASDLAASKPLVDHQALPEETRAATHVKIESLAKRYSAARDTMAEVASRLKMEEKPA